MLLRSLPDPAFGNAETCRRFQQRWGHENCVVLRHTRHANFTPDSHALSIRAAWGGTEHCLVGGRDVGLDDDNFLILNQGRDYSTSIDSPQPVETLGICFRPGMVADVCAAMAASLDGALDKGETLGGRSAEFPENLQPHDKLVTPVLRFIKSHLLLGLQDEAWYEEQLHFLLERMRTHRGRLLVRIDCLQLGRSSTRREVFRRIGYATDYIHCNYSRPLDLGVLAGAAGLSKYHFLRLFTLVHGITPVAYLQRKRTRVALRLLQTTRLTLNEVASAVGFAGQTTVLRQIRRWTGLGPVQIRAQALDGLSLGRKVDPTAGQHAYLRR